MKRTQRAAVALIVVAAVSSGCGTLQSSTRPQASSPGANLPQPVPRPVTRTGAGAQVAWLWTQAQGESSLVGYDPTGRQVGRLVRSADSAGIWRSADGASLFAAGAATITAYAAADGKRLHTYQRPALPIVGEAFSPDGRYLALLLLDGSRLQVAAIDLQSGESGPAVTVPHDANAAMPGLSGFPPGWAWADIVFAPDSLHLYAISDWGGPAKVSAFSLAVGRLQQTGTAPMPKLSCAGPAMALSVVDTAATLAAFCHYDGAVWLINLQTLSSHALRPIQDNPFWLSPVFTPDGKLLYLLEPQTVQVVDFARQRVVGPVPLPKPTDDRGPLAALTSFFVTPAEAGYVASTVPVSPDGLKLFVAQPDGVMVLHVPDLKPLAKLASGVNAGEVWVSGDGRTLYATADNGRRLVIMSSDGSGMRSVSLPANANGFVASEHG